MLYLNKQQLHLFGQIQTSQTGVPPFSDTFLYEVSEYSKDEGTYESTDLLLLRSPPKQNHLMVPNHSVPILLNPNIAVFDGSVHHGD